MDVVAVWCGSHCLPEWCFLSTRQSLFSPVWKASRLGGGLSHSIRTAVGSIYPSTYLSIRLSASSFLYICF